jgi:LmbE family N-acetylglucosaminyl deacetylase
MVTVPNILKEVPPLPRDPVVAYMADLFSRPCPLVPDIVLDVTDQLEAMLSMLACHRSQSPFARLGRYLRRRNVEHPLDQHYPAVNATTNSCASPHSSRQPQLVSLVPPVFAGCGQPLLG